ncbi:MAG: peptidoglycan DD-metalloendopeptidase family protein [Candidatus Entotheonellia bacterium]
MRRWEHHRTRSKVALLLLINLVALLGGKYIALITIVKSELFGDAIAFAKAPKKKLPKPHLSRTQLDHPPPPPTTQKLAKLDGKQRSPRALLHVIRRGETLSEIAASYGISVDALRRANQLRHSNHVIVGETLRIPPQEGTEARVELRQTVKSSDRAPSLGGQRHVERRTQAPAMAPRGLRWPAEGPLTSPFGERDHVMGGGGTQFHAGIDISVPTGTPVQAAQEGIVVFAGYNGAYGKAVKLDHPNGLSTLYAHNSRILVHVGQTVKAGQVICLSGSTGRSTGPHLHFEVHKDGLPVDPLPSLD